MSVSPWVLLDIIEDLYLTLLTIRPPGGLDWQGRPIRVGTSLFDTDASNFGLGRVLSQIQNDVEHVVAHCSRALRPSQRRYCVAIEGFVLYSGGDYGLHLNIMLLVQVWAYVMSDMFAHR